MAKKSEPAGKPEIRLEAAMMIRAAWMRKMGLSEEEIAYYCDAERYPADTVTEQESMRAVDRLRNFDISRMF